MIIEYEFGGDDIHPADDFEYEIDYKDFRYYIKTKLSDMDKKSLIELILNADIDEFLFDYFYEEIYDEFYGEAYEQFNNKGSWDI